jgi:hypothetical protein
LPIGATDRRTGIHAPFPQMGLDHTGLRADRRWLAREACTGCAARLQDGRFGGRR